MSNLESLTGQTSGLPVFELCPLGATRPPAVASTGLGPTLWVGPKRITTQLQPELLTIDPVQLAWDIRGSALPILDLFLAPIAEGQA